MLRPRLRPTRTILGFTCLIFLLLGGRIACAADYSQWEKEIAELTAGDVTQPPAPGAILFLGSSSIRLWTTLTEDFPEVRTLRRGFGGSKAEEVRHFLPRLLVPYAPRQVVIYVGTNDVADGRSADRVVSDVTQLCREIRAAAGTARLTFISIAPNPARWAFCDTMVEINRRLATWLGEQENMEFVDVWPAMLTTDGLPRPELFVADQLHMNPAGYALWREVLKPHLLPEPR